MNVIGPAGLAMTGKNSRVPKLLVKNRLKLYTGTGQLVPKSTRTLVNSYPCLVNSYLSQLVPKSTRTLVYL